jgi:chitodextrinase
MKKKIVKLNTVLFLASVFFISSCTKTPSGCLSVDKGKTAKVNEEVQFDGSCSTNETSYAWEFGDGATETGNPVKHKYSTAGTYMVKLTVKNKKKSASITENVVVNP